MARVSPYPPNAHPGYASREGLPPFVSEGYLGIRRCPGPFKREAKNVVFFIAETMRRSDYRREKCPPTGATGGIR